ncbi:MAG: hypothetical protein HQ534_06110 [Armatimonadetes bacterium]|nr:hypothetical protein [Armatimonadota bacterium]
MKNFKSFPIRNKLQLISLFTLSFISMILIITPCSKTTEIAKGSLSGTARLEGQTDHSGITVAIYDLAELDSDDKLILFRYCKALGESVST